MPYITYDPDEPGDRDRAYLSAFLGLIVTMGSIGGAFYYIFSLIDLFHGKWSADILYSFGLLSLISVVVFFVLFARLDKELRSEIAKKYFLFFFGGMLDLSGVIGTIIAIHSLCTARTGTLLLIGSLISILLITLAIILLYRKIEGYAPIKLFADKDVVSEINRASVQQPLVIQPKTTPNQSQCIIPNTSETNYFYCHKCGKKLPDDSSFCNSCGTRLQ